MNDYINDRPTKARIIIGRFWPVQENPRILYWPVLAGSVVKGLRKKNDFNNLKIAQDFVLIHCLYVIII
jgi:hypothetical protein